jgi:DNA replication protein DnaC
MITSQLEYLNSKQGNLNEIDGVQCDICNNKGIVYIPIDEFEIGSKKCNCHVRRKIARNIKKSGLADNFERYTFDKFLTEETYQKHIKEKAMHFVKNHKTTNTLKHDIYKWFYIAGQVGSGKSHICTAISKELIEQGYDFIYLDYAHEMQRLTNELRSWYNDVREKAEKRLEELKFVQVLYVDDFMKTSDGKHLFDIINARYGRNNTITIISSENVFDKNDLSTEAIPSRIYERCDGYYLVVNKDANKNMRLK